MNQTLKNILVVIVGVLIGGSVNMGLILISGHVIPPPAGADVTTMEGLTKSIHLFQPKHFLFPFLAHAIGTFVGAMIVAYFVPKYKMVYALAIAVFNLIGGVMNVMMLPMAPLWFDVVDLVGAYIPMGFLAGKLAGRK